MGHGHRGHAGAAVLGRESVELVGMIAGALVVLLALALLTAGVTWFYMRWLK
jgi:hypothetical protein